MSQGCCSGGASNPIAGGAATGVLQKNQMEISGNYQIMNSNKFFSQTNETSKLFNNLNSNYLFLRTDYGISEKLTLSLASGYFINKTLIGFENIDTTNSRGVSDLIILPRLDVFNKINDRTKTELTLGIGMKIPLGSHSDSTLIISHPIIGDIYSINPPTVQNTNGSIDLVYYAFFFRSYIKKKLSVFTNILYLNRGFNSLGQKFGDYASLGIFVGKTFFKKIGVTNQIRMEWLGKMEAAENIDLLGYYNIEQASTGSSKVFFVPQISYIHKSLILYITGEIPIYQNVNGTQVGSNLQLTAGINYRFFIKKQPVCEVE
tara:strand:+ start:1420 stop:2373 length:954 start_codon:yes stop_codon:yes gene_type:complete